jgi:dolichyl-diphosphooligosaccharide--protein glycosyltransferase
MHKHTKTLTHCFFPPRQYLYEHGAKKFFTWFDYMSWYPLGRPVGSTIYPGMQFTAVWIKTYFLPNWSINDVCCYVPAWFGIVATFITALIAYECTLPENSTFTFWDLLVHMYKGKEIKQLPPAPHKTLGLGISSPSLECALFTMAIMAIVPAHLMRSVGGGFDNESVAMTAMTLTFYFWVRSLRTDSSWWMGALAGLAYFYMVASWGGYIFVLNMVGVHAGLLVLMGRFSTKVYLSYSLFYLVGTSLAIQIPVVGWSPLKSLEQLGPCAVFLGYQGLQICEVIRRRQNMTRVQAFQLRLKVAGAGLGMLMLLGMVLLPKGYFGPLSSRVRGLFVQHTKTGNPLVDSVAEHQAASNQAYFQYLHHVCLLAPIGYLLTLAHLSDASSFLLAWGSVSYFFSSKMVRLILLMSPIGSILGGIAAGRIISWSLTQLWSATSSKSDAAPNEAVPRATPVGQEGDPGVNGGKTKKGGRSKVKKPVANETTDVNPFSNLIKAVTAALASKEGVLVKRTVAVLTVVLAYVMGVTFTSYSWKLSGDLSHPSIIFRARTRAGNIIKIDDYREAYWWLRDNTPLDSRIVAWWDYGYQITAIANRTTIADGNTWNHEHIALLGKCLTTDLIEGHEIARQLGDYLLLWGGGGGDDLAKSPHLARIANSVYRDHCPEADPTCRSFGFIDRQGTPSPMMQRSLLYQLHGHGLKPTVFVSPKLFTPVFNSKYGKVRIFKIENVDMESKKWAADPANRKCDAPGSWYCPGQYPPGLSKILSRKKDFAQLEDFNSKVVDEEYQRKYFEALRDPEAAARQAMQNEAAKNANKQVPKNYKMKTVSVGSDGEVVPEPAFTRPDKDTIDRVYNDWQDTDATTAMWSLISQNRLTELQDWLLREPAAAYMRSKDGRGPMWWAYESRNDEVVKLLKKLGLPDTDKDANGRAPSELLEARR